MSDKMKDRNELATSFDQLRAVLVKSERQLNPELHLQLLSEPLLATHLYAHALAVIDNLTTQIEATVSHAEVTRRSS